ncbi:MAG: mechanosensitive ion channel protein MscS [Rhodocyclales bacterium GWA2_65_19]|nr:MAG: mechanosensitive ion channel protein MscS [Rhodocyclales bacterium GWA2_65_19]
MSFWDSAIAFFWRDEVPAVLLMAAALAAVLLHYRREDRKSLLNTIGFFLVCLAGQFTSSLMHALHFTNAAALFHEVFLIGAGIALIRLWGLLIFRVVLPLARFSPARIAEDIFVIVAYIAWGLVRLRYAGLDLGSILATSAMITAVVAFAMQDTLGNILGGLALQLDNSVEIGDWIKVDDISGRVVDIRWRSTLVETRNWETVVFPNSQLMKSKFLVLGRRADQPVQWRRWVWFNIALDETPAKVANVVEQAIGQAEIANVAKSPAPNCVLMEMDKGCARYALRYWLADLAADDPTDGAVRWHIHAALERAGIKLAVEEHNVHLTKENEKYEEALHQRELQRRLKTLKRIELFSHLTDEELNKLATGVRYAPFARGNVISKQGATAHWLYVIISGEAEVSVEGANGEKRVLNVLSGGDFFGEMGMMTGAPRSASVLAQTDVECYRVDKEMFAELMHARPGIAEEVSHVLVARRAQLDSALHNLDEESLHKEIHHRHGEVLATIRQFFGL